MARNRLNAKIHKDEAPVDLAEVPPADLGGGDAPPSLADEQGAAPESEAPPAAEPAPEAPAVNEPVSAPAEQAPPAVEAAPVAQVFDPATPIGEMSLAQVAHEINAIGDPRAALNAEVELLKEARRNRATAIAAIDAAINELDMRVRKEARKAHMAQDRLYRLGVRQAALLRKNA